MINSYFFDTYALIELHNANPNYEKYKGAAIITTKMNLMEFHFGVLREMGKYVADIQMGNLNNFVVEFDLDQIKFANHLKYKFRKLSYIDCLGYIVALNNGVPFVTGDEGFKELPNVEFKK
tara:strand:- start:3599 stop:3961 length:363 start_codon:yes stop_codon:yes gene_type:complete